MSKEANLDDLRNQLSKPKHNVVHSEYPQEHLMRMKVMKENADLWIKTNKLSIDAAQKYFDSMGSLHDSNKLAVSDNRCSKSQAAGYCSEVRYFHKEVLQTIKSDKDKNKSERKRIPNEFKSVVNATHRKNSNKSYRNHTKKRNLESGRVVKTTFNKITARK